MLVDIKDIIEYNILKKSLKKHVNCYNIQLYYPPITLYTNDIDNSMCYLKSNNIIHSINKKINENIYNVNILENNNSLVSMDIYIKKAPILNPYKYISNEYSNVSTPYLSSLNIK